MISKLKLIFFATISNMLLINILGFCILTDNYLNSSYLYLLFYLIISIILGFLFNGFKNINFLKSIKKNIVLKLLITIYSFIIVSFITILVAIIMKKFFYFKIDIIILFILLLLTSIIISNASISSLIDQASLIMVAVFALYIIPLNHQRDFTLLLPLEFDISKVIYGYVLILFPLDNLIYSLSSDNIKNGFTKKTYILINIFSLFYLLFMIIDSYTLVGAHFYEGMRYSGLFRWQLYSGNKFIENFSIILLLMIIICSVYKNSFYLNTLKRVLLMKNNYFYNSLLFVLLALICLFIYLNINELDSILDLGINISIGILSIVYIIIVYYSYKLKPRRAYGD